MKILRGQLPPYRWVKNINFNGNQSNTLKHDLKINIHKSSTIDAKIRTRIYIFITFNGVKLYSRHLIKYSRTPEPSLLLAKGNLNGFIQHITMGITQNKLYEKVAQQIFK
ncbi:hypothetical protein HZS_5410 [Henneguya salminicola]|nr:hypothetical protein HZS_5410 [Henneguya salminicola]